ncbi:MAG: helix-turn-helix domain-containing protein [Leucobacter sp.]
MEQNRRGILYPQRLPEFHRLSPPLELAHAVSWFWIPEWNLPAGEESRQELLPFPACNFVVEPNGIGAVGPTTARSERVLSGSGWAVGALLRPAAVPALVPDPASCRDSIRTVPDPELLSRVRSAMTDADMSASERREHATATLSNWLLDRVPPPRPHSDGALANELAEALADPAIVRVDQLPERLHVSARSLQRLAERFFGLSLHSMIRRRRLQEGAQQLRENPGLGIADLASELGYTDHAHFTTDFKTLLGMTPSEYRARASSV